MKKSILFGLIITALVVGFVRLADSSESSVVSTDGGEVSRAESNEPEAVAIDGEKPEVEIQDEDDAAESEGDSIVISELSEPEGEGFPVATNHFEITQTSDGAYNVTLLAIINRPEQYEEYKKQLKQFKQEALAYMEENQVNIEDAEISYTPEEATDL